MGTNYYMKAPLRPGKCPTCGHEEEDLSERGFFHVGKLSTGWRFLFHGYPLGIPYGADRRPAVNIDAMKVALDKLAELGWRLYDDNDAMDLDDFWTIVDMKQGQQVHQMGYMDPKDYCFYDGDFS